MPDFINFNYLGVDSFFNMNHVVHFEEVITEHMPDDTDSGVMFRFSSGDVLLVGFDIDHSDDWSLLKYYLSGAYGSPPCDREVYVNYIEHKTAPFSVEPKKETKFVRADDVQEMLGIGKSTLFQWVADGKFPKPKKYGRNRLWPIAQVSEWIEKEGA